MTFQSSTFKAVPILKELVVLIDPPPSPTKEVLGLKGCYKIIVELDTRTYVFISLFLFY